MNETDVVNRARQAGVQIIRFIYCDFSGVARTKAIHVANLANKLREGVGLTRAQMAINLLEQLIPIEGMEPVGEIRLVPDPDSFCVLPWTPSSAGILCDQLDHTHQNWGACPRSFLKEMIACAEQQGIVVEAAFEDEFFLATQENGGYVPFDHAPVYSTIGLDLGAAVMQDIVQALQDQDIQVEQVINEYGPGQQEISVRHAGALKAADTQMKFRDTVRGVGLQHGLLATFAPKPFPDTVGSGAHIHFSLWDRETGDNLLYDPADPRGLSQIGRHAIGGVLHHLPALVALTCPNYNSYRRLQPHAWSSAYTAWGFDNREAAMRVASPFWGREKQSYNLELKTADASANPYIALGGLIAALLDGIDRQLDPGQPCERDPANLTDEERRESGIQRLPTEMKTALDLLEGDEVLMGAMPDLMRRGYLAIRRSEEEVFSGATEEFEIENHFYKF